MAIDRIYLIPDYNRIEESVKLSAKWEAGFEYNDFFMPSLLDDETALRRRVDLYRSLGRPAGIDTLHGVFFDICVNSIDDRIRTISQERMYKSMEIASELNCKGVVFHTNAIPGFETKVYIDGWLGQHELFYRQLCSEYANINIYVENMFDYKPDMLEALAARMQDVANFGVCFDVAHCNVHDIPMEKWMEELLPYTRHLHINDNMGRSDDHLSLGKGNINWDKYFNLLSKADQDMGMLIEVSKIENQIESLLYLEEQRYFEKIKEK